MARQVRLANLAMLDGPMYRDSSPDTAREPASRVGTVRWHVGLPEYIIKISKKKV